MRIRAQILLAGLTLGMSAMPASSHDSLPGRLCEGGCLLPPTGLIGWWPGDPRYAHAAFYAYAHPAPAGFSDLSVSPAAAHWDPALGEYILNWDDVRTADDPRATALEFARSAFRHACIVCGWDTGLAASAEGTPPPVV